MSGIQMVVRYSDHHLITGPVFKWNSNNGPFGDWTTFDHSNTPTSPVLKRSVVQEP